MDLHEDAPSVPAIPAAANSGKKLGRFELAEVVGEGAFGTVYRARDPQLDRDVAIKVPRSGVLAPHSLAIGCATSLSSAVSTAWNENMGQSNRSLPRRPLSSRLPAQGGHCAAGRGGRLQLNSREYRTHRRLMIRILRLAARCDPSLFAELMGFPDDVPDLASLAPPGGNTRPAGVEESHYAPRRQRKLPDTY